jgi:hypothetical protein
MTAQLADKREWWEEQRQWADSAEIHQVKNVNGKVSIQYSVVENEATSQYKMTSFDAPTIEFTFALQTLAPFIAELLFREKNEREAQRGKITVTCVNYKAHRGVLFADIEISLTLANGMEATIKMPPMPLYDDKEEPTHYSKEATQAIGNVAKRARDYMSGRRAQGNLFNQANQDDGE